MINFLVDFTSGVAAGALSCVSGHFLDTVKVRMQMDPSMTSTLSTLQHIIKRQGFLKLYSGMYYPFFITTAGFSLVFAIYQLYRTVREKSTYSLWDGIQNGAVVGLVFTFLTTPVELVKCVMQYDIQKKYSSSRQCLRSILRQQGLRGLYRGSTIMYCRQILGFSAQFAVYQLLKGFYLTEERPHLTFLESMVVGPAASVMGWLFSYPQDVIKTKLQVNPAGTYNKWKGLPDGGIIECSKQIIKKSGWRGFFVGLSPCLIRASYSQGIGIMTYQKTRQMLWEHRTSGY